MYHGPVRVSPLVTHDAEEAAYVIYRQCSSGNIVCINTCLWVGPGEDFRHKNAHGKALRAFQQPIMICLASACKQWQAKVVSECGEKTRRTHVKKKKRKRGTGRKKLCVEKDRVTRNGSGST